MHFLLIVCLVVCVIQILYASLFLFAFHKRTEVPARSPRGVSVIICAHDEEANLRELIPLILQQDHQEFEIIVVEDRSNDGTFDYLLEATKEHPRLKMVRVTHLPEHLSGKKFALTLGIRAATFEWILMTDADCRPNSNQWLTHMSSCFSDGRDIVLGFSAYRRSRGLLNAFIRFETFLTGIQYMGLAAIGYPYMGVGRNLAYRKSLFLTSKGFHPHQGVLGGDDDLFVNAHATKQNTTTAMGKESLVYSIPKSSWKSFYYQKVRHLSAGKRYRWRSKLSLGLFSLSWIAIWMIVVPVAFFAEEGGWIAGLLILRWMILVLLFHDAPRKMGDSFEAWKVPLLDLIYAFYYLVAGLTAAVSKKVRWRV